MSPVQRSDDPGRFLRSVWLGPQNAWRWPFDATFGEWIVAIATTILGFFVLWLVLPLGVLILLVAYAWARWANRSIRSHRNWQWGYFSLFALGGLVIFPSPGSWLMPMSWWLAPLGAIILAVQVVRMARPYLDSNRPFRYWLATWQRVAAGPRARRALATFAPASLIIDDDDPEDDARARLMLAVLAYEEVHVATYRRTRTETTEVEAALWAPRQGRDETSVKVLKWLENRRVPHEIGAVNYRRAWDAAGNEHEVLADIELSIDGSLVPNDRVITIEIETGRVEHYARREFAETFEPVQEFAR